MYLFDRRWCFFVVVWEIMEFIVFVIVYEYVIVNFWLKGEKEFNICGVVGVIDC